MQTRTFSALRANPIQFGFVTVRVGSKDGPLATGLKKEDGSDLSNPFPIPKNGRPVFQAPNGNYWLNLVGPGFNLWEEAQFLDVADVLAVGDAKEAAEAAAESAAESAAEAEGKVLQFKEQELGYFTHLIGDGDSLVSFLEGGGSVDIGYVARVNAVDDSAEVIPSTWKCTATDAELPGGATPGELYEGKLYVQNEGDDYYVFEYVGEGRVDEQTGAVVTLREDLASGDAAIAFVQSGVGAGDGVTDDSEAIQESDSYGFGTVSFGPHTYRIDGDVTRENSIFEFHPGASIVGDGAIKNAGVGRLADIPNKTILGKLTVRDEWNAPGSDNGFDSHPWMGQVMRLDAKAMAGQCAFYLSNDRKAPVIGETHYVGLHTRNDTTPDAPSVWGMNPVVVKNIKIADSPTGKAGALGMEISVSNNTDEPGTPLSSGELGGLFVSYIHVVNRAAHAIATGGYPGTIPGQNGFENGLWLDGIVSDGTHINLRDEVSGNAGVRRGLSTTGVSAFTDGAVCLGNEHRIAGQRSDNANFINIAKVNSSNQLEIGQSGILTNVVGTLRTLAGAIEVGQAASVQAYVDFHSSGNNNDYDSRIYATGGTTENGNGFLQIIANALSLACAVSPSTDNARTLGTALLRWANTFSVNFRPGNGAAIWTSGSGSPEGAVAAPVGSLYTRTDGGAGTTLYVKESGTGNTGWVAK